jgi:membrane-associated phospholipid phosphatase
MLTERRRRQITLLSAALLFCVVSFFFFDKTLTLYLDQFNRGFWRNFWKTMTRAGQSEWYLVTGIILYAGFRKQNRQLSRAGLFLFSTVAVSGLVADILKLILGRARPKLFLQQNIYGFDFFQGHFEHAWTSFPSGHSATAMSVAMTLSLLLPRFRLVFMAGAILVVASRVILCQHYLSDVIAGSMLGFITVVLLYQRFFHTPADETRIV